MQKLDLFECEKGGGFGVGVLDFYESIGADVTDDAMEREAGIAAAEGMGLSVGTV